MSLMHPIVSETKKVLKKEKNDEGMTETQEPIKKIPMAKLSII